MFTVPSLAERDHPYRYVRNAWFRQNDLRELARLLVTLHAPEVKTCLKHCASIANPSMRNRIRALAETVGECDEIPSSCIFTRTHQALELGLREKGDVITLTSKTENGEREEFSVSNLAREAIVFIVGQQRFDVRSLPGNLTYNERILIAETLENAGLFREERI
jgi:hypothetical protein